MISAIITHTPIWVWALLGGLLYLGFSQTKRRTVSLKRSTILPLAMIALSIFGTVNVFGSSPSILLSWLGAAALSFIIVIRFSNWTVVKYYVEKQQFTLPGSWIPMMLILGIFVTKYVVGVMVGTQPAYANKLNFAITCTLFYGAFSGVFLARAVGLWRIALINKKVALTNSVIDHPLSTK